jgi:membrane protein implicated in regulation of membrane protease activity
MLNDAWSFVFAWYNLPFTFLLATCLLLATLQFLGLGGEHDGDVDADIDVDVEVDVDVDADLDLDAEADLDVDGDSGIDHSAGVDGGSGALSLHFLAYLGFGKAPLLVVLLILFGSVGVLGWLFNSLAEGYFTSYPSIVFAAVLPLSLMIGTFFTSRTARFIGRALPPVSTTATRAQALVGRRGIVTSPYVDGKYGLVRLRDAGGTSISVFAVIDGEEPIERQSEVVLVTYDTAGKRYTVTRS